MGTCEFAALDRDRRHRNPTNEGLSRTRKLVKSLLADDFTSESGLAKGIDAEAHRTAIKEGGRTIAVPARLFRKAIRARMPVCKRKSPSVTC